MESANADMTFRYAIHVHTTISDLCEQHPLRCLSFYDIEYAVRDESLGDLGLTKDGHGTLGADDDVLGSSSVSSLGFPSSAPLFMDDDYVTVSSDAFGEAPSSHLVHAREPELATTAPLAPYVLGFSPRCAPFAFVGGGET